MSAVEAAVDEVVLGAPATRLRPFVDRYIGYRERAALPLVRREVAGAFVVVILGWGAPLDVVDPRDAARGAHRVDSFVAGMFDGPCTTRLVGVGEGVQLLLAPLAARRILGLPLVELTNRAVGVAALPGGWLDRLRVRLATAADWSARFALLDAALTARLADTEPVDARLAWAWRRLAETGGQVAVGALAGELGWSRRHLAARFRDEVGLTPKTTARLLRFQRAYATLTAGPALAVDPAPPTAGGGSGATGRRGSGDPGGATGQSGPGGPAGQRGPAGPGGSGGPLAGGWAQIAARCGYYDQSHLIRDFREFAGETPTALGSHSSNPG